MISCLVQKRFGSSNAWPITFLSYGEKYSTHLVSSSYLQHSVICSLNLYRNEDERIYIQESFLKFIDQYLSFLLINESDIM